MTPQEADQQIARLVEGKDLTPYEQEHHSDLLVAAQKVLNEARGITAYGNGEHMTTAIGTFDLSGDGSAAARMVEINNLSLADAKKRLEEAKLRSDVELIPHLEGAIKDVEARHAPDQERIEKHFKDSEEQYLKSVVDNAKAITASGDAWRDTKIKAFMDSGWSRDDAIKMAGGTPPAVGAAT